MRPFFPKKFLKQFKRLNISEQQKFYTALDMFCVNAFAPTLRNHALYGKYSGFRSIDITGDIRAVYLPLRGNVARFSVIGTHHQLFGS
jgi:addiction module RelE/StbE family toxin